VVPTHALQIHDGARPPSWKNRKIAISLPQLERFRHILAYDLLGRSTRWKFFNFLKFKMTVTAIMKNLKIAIFRQRFDQSARNLAW